MNPTHQEYYTVRHSEGDRHGRLKLANWFDYLQEAAANHATQLGVGLANIDENERLWVLSRLKLSILRYPKIGEKIRVLTYPNGLARIFALRQFQITDEQGAQIGCATSYWLMLDRKKMRPVKLDWLLENFPDNSKLPAYFNLDEKLPIREMPELFQAPVRYSMEDVNLHLNNAQYAAMAQDAINALGIEPPLPKTLELHFVSAVEAPDKLSISAEKTGNSIWLQGYNDKGVLSFSAVAEV